MLRSKIFQHLTAALCALLGFYVIYRISSALFLPKMNWLTPWLYARIMWATQDAFFRLLVIMNFVIKPLFIYYLTWILLGMLAGKKKPSAKK